MEAALRASFCGCFHFTHNKTMTQKGKVTRLQPHSWRDAELGCETMRWVAGTGHPPPTTNGDESSFSEGLSWTGRVGAVLPGVPTQPLFPSTELPVTQSGVRNDPRPLPCLPPTTRQSPVQSGGLWASENREVGGRQGQKNLIMFLCAEPVCGSCQHWDNRQTPYPVDKAPWTPQKPQAS